MFRRQAPASSITSPSTATNFFSRGPELAALSGYLRPLRRGRRPPVSTVVMDGLAGTGKSMLMMEAAFRHKEGFADVVKIGLLGSSDKPMPPAKLIQEMVRRR
jgi:hypothetical protein